VSGDPKDAAPRALARFFHHRWALPALAHVAKDGGCKFVTLHKRLGVAPPVLRRTLAQLGQLDLVVRNTGYGHPLRPEYVLGDLGKEVASPAQRLWQWIEEAEVERSLLKKWSLPALTVIGLGAERFSEINRLLVGATPRATTLALKELVAVDLASRSIGDGYPPTPYYALVRRARRPLAHARALSAPLVQALVA